MRRRSSSVRVARFLAGALALACAAGLAQAQVLYKWIDESGKVHYADQPKKGFNGPVTKIEPDASPTPVAPAVAPPKATPPEATKAQAPAEDMLTQRRARRATLEARLTAAREKL